MKVIVNKKGGIVLPKEVREQLGIRRGMMLKLEIIDGKICANPRENFGRRCRYR